MTVTDDQRFRLHESLNRTLGEEVAATLMQYLPPTGWSELATRTDVERAVTFSEKALRLDLDATAHRLDAKIDSVFHDLDTKIAAVHHGLGARIDALGAEIARRPTFLQMVMLDVGLVGLVLAAVRLG